MFDVVMNYVTAYLPVLLAVMGGLTVVAAAIAPLTKTAADDKLVNALRWLQAKLAMLSLARAAAPLTVRPKNAAKGYRRVPRK